MSVIIRKSFIGHAEEYFEKELTNKREKYSPEEGIQAGQWMGKGALIMNLSGEVKKEDFEKLSRGIEPQTNERFRRLILSRTREVDGKLTEVKGIAGWEIVISAPKSVSQIIIIGNDKRARNAHDEAYKVVLEAIEQLAYANNGGGKKELTGNLIIAVFSHDLSRPAQNGFVAPQVHEHCFCMNGTYRQDGVLKPIDSFEMFRYQHYFKSIYYAELAARLQIEGYVIEVDKDTGAPEIAGISKEYRDVCSPRRKDILKLAKIAGKNFRQLGLVNRSEKVYDRDIIREQHTAMEGLFDFQASRAVESARNIRKKLGSDLENKNAEIVQVAKKSVAFAIAKVSKREVFFETRRILFEANKRGIGRTNVAAIESEFENLKSDKKVNIVKLSSGREVAFLRSIESIKNEFPDHIGTVQTEKSLEDEISKIKISKDSTDTFHKEFLDLSEEQQTTVKEVLRARTSVTSLDGDAGVGKTETLSLINKFAQTADYQVVGIMTMKGAKQELESINVKSQTLQSSMANHDQPQEQKRFFIVDESSFVSSPQMNKFVRDTVKQGERVLFIGDLEQQNSAGVGNSSNQTQRDKLIINTENEKTKKQIAEANYPTVDNLSENKVSETIDKIDGRGQAFEITNREDRHQEIVKTFAAKPEKTLVFAPISADCQEINAKIHTALIISGQIKKEETEISILRPRNELIGVERESAGAYQLGDIISYKRGSKVNKIPAKSLAKVIKTDRDHNLLTVELGKGEEKQEITYDPKRLCGVIVFREENIKISEGERLQFHQPFKVGKTNVVNGTFFRVNKIMPKQIALETENGKAIKIKRNEQYPIDYGYAVNSYSLQEKAIGKLLIHVDTDESKNTLYEKLEGFVNHIENEEILIYSNNVKELSSKIVRKTEKNKSSSQAIEVNDIQKKDVIESFVTTSEIKNKQQSIETESIKKLVKTDQAFHLPEFETEITTKDQVSGLIKKVIEFENPTLKEEAKVTDSSMLNVDKLTLVKTGETSPFEIQENIVDELKTDSVSNQTSKTSQIESSVIFSPIDKRTTPKLKITDKPKIDVIKSKLPIVNFEITSQIKDDSQIGSLDQPKLSIENQNSQEIFIIEDSQNCQETIIKEVLKMSRNSLVKQNIKHDPQIWKKYSNDIINHFPNENAESDQLKLLCSIKEIKSLDEQIISAKKSKLEVNHAILNNVSKTLQDLLIKTAYDKYVEEVEIESGKSIESKIKIETKNAKKRTTKIEYRDEVKRGSISTQAEIEGNQQTIVKKSYANDAIKPTPKLRDFEKTNSEEMIKELVAAMREESRKFKMVSFDYKREKFLARIYRSVSDQEPYDTDLVKLKTLSERFDNPLPSPKNTIEARILISDNMTNAERSSFLRLQIVNLDKMFKSESSEKSNTFEDYESSNDTDYFGRTDVYFTKPNRYYNKWDSVEGKPYCDYLTEAKDRGMIPADVSYTSQSSWEHIEHRSVFQLGIADAIQKQIQQSLDEQGIELNTQAQQILYDTIDSWATQQPNEKESVDAQSIKQIYGFENFPKTKLEAKAYIFNQNDERIQDEISCSLAMSANESLEYNQRIAEEQLEDEKNRKIEEENSNKKEAIEENKVEADNESHNVDDDVHCL